MCYVEECSSFAEVEDIPAQTDCDPDNVHRLTDMRHYHKILNTDVDVRDLRAAHPMTIIPDNHDINDDVTVSCWHCKLYSNVNPKNNLTGSVEIQAWVEWVPTRYTVDSNGTIFFPRLYRYGTLLGKQFYSAATSCIFHINYYFCYQIKYLALRHCPFGYKKCWTF